MAVGTMSAANSTAGNLTAGSNLTITGTAIVSPGTLSIVASPTLKWATTLTGFDQNVLARLGQYTAIDATGSGNGWTLSVSSTPFTAQCRLHQQCSTGLHPLPSTALSVNGSPTTPKSNKRPVATCATGSTCTLPSYSKIAFPLTVNTGCSTSGVCTPIVVATTAPTTGMGAINCALDWWLNLPANTYAGTYTNTITTTISTGP